MPSNSTPAHEVTKARASENAKRFVMMRQFWSRQRHRRKRAVARVCGEHFAIAFSRRNPA
jgi:hypothetical protein